jgi:hypothetical protein
LVVGVGIDSQIPWTGEALFEAFERGVAFGGVFERSLLSQFDESFFFSCILKKKCKKKFFFFFFFFFGV